MEEKDLQVNDEIQENPVEEHAEKVETSLNENEAQVEQSEKTETTEEIEGADEKQGQDNQETKEDPKQEEKPEKKRKGKKEKTGLKEKRPNRKARKAEKQAAELEERKNLSEDELYAQIQTEKLLKKKKAKRFATLLALCSAMVLALCVIVLAAVPISFKPNCLKGDGIVDVTLYGKSASAATLDFSDEDQKEQVQLFNKLFNQSFEQSCLTSLFSGSLNQYNIDEQTYHSSPSVNDKLYSTLMSNYIGSGNYLLLIHFNEPRKLTYQNGGKYFSTWVSYDFELEFSQAYVVVNKDEGIKDTQIFLVAKYPTTTNPNKLVCVTVRADTSKIYNSWDKLTA